jgi:hypothetical protein
LREKSEAEGGVKREREKGKGERKKKGRRTSTLRTTGGEN